LAEEGIWMSRFISYENALDIDECDSLLFLKDDERTKVIALFLEGVKDGRKFLRVAREVTRKKPIIALKGGKTEAGRKAALSHTASLAGSAEIYSAAFKQAGIIEAKSWEELLDFSKAFLQPLPRGRRVAIVTNGGGFGVLAADECERRGLNLPEPSEELKNKLMEKLPSYCILKNPIDLTGDTDANRYMFVLEECLSSEEYDGIILILLFQTPSLDEKIIEVIPPLRKYEKPIICCATGSSYSIEFSRILNGKGFPVYPSPERAVRAFSILAEYAELNSSRLS